MRLFLTIFALLAVSCKAQLWETIQQGVDSLVNGFDSTEDEIVLEDEERVVTKRDVPVSYLLSLPCLHERIVYSIIAIWSK